MSKKNKVYLKILYFICKKEKLEIIEIDNEYIDIYFNVSFNLLSYDTYKKRFELYGDEYTEIYDTLISTRRNKKRC